MNKKTKYILFVVIVAMLVAPLFGCGATNPTATPDAGVTDAVVSDAPVTDGTPAPDAGDGVTAAPSADTAVTPAPGESATVAPTGNTGNTGNSGNKATPKPSTVTKKPANNEPVLTGPYKGVVLMGFNPCKMSPYAYRSNLGTQQEKAFWHYSSVYDTTNAKTKRGVKYFTLTFATPADKFTSATYKAATAGGKFPVILDLGVGQDGLANIEQSRGRARNFNWAKEFINNGTTKKIYFDLWMWDFDYKRPKKGSGDDAWNYIEDGWLKDTVCGDIKKIADEFKKMNADVEVYVGGLHPYADTYPRADKTLYPDNFYEYDEDEAVFEHDNAAPAKLKAHNQVVKKFCDANGYKFIDYFKCGLAGSNGWAKEEYMADHGAMLNKDGLKIYGDYMMEQMGLPKAVQEY